MMIRLKTTILLLIYSLFLQSAYSQSQKNMTDYLVQKFTNYSAAIRREEIFVQSDRSEYIAGEDLWVKMYLIDRQTNMPISDDKIVYFELLDPKNTPVVQKRFYIDKGNGPGQILLPDSLSSGTYTIRAYTGWMKNFLPYNCFLKDIKIYNTLKKKAFQSKIYSDETFNNGNFPEQLQTTSDLGLTLRVNNFIPGILDIYINTDDRYRNDNNNTFYLFIQTHGIINHVSAEKSLTDITRISISKKELIPGINQITIFDSKGKPVCNRFIYTPQPEKQVLTVNSPESFKKREKVSLELSLGGVINQVDPANLSISVTPVNSNPENTGLSDYMIFGSEFGLLPREILNGKSTEDYPAGKLDTLLLTARSNWIEWDKILSDNLPELRFQVENEDHFLTGKLLTLDQKAPDNEEYLILSSPGKVAEFQYARTDIQGNFCFKVHVDESIKDLIIQLDDISKKYKINIESSFSDKYLKSSVRVDSIIKSIPGYISKLSINYQVNKIYETSFMGNRVIPVIKPVKHKRFYGKPDISLVLADYIKLPVMQEVFFELLPGVPLKNKKSVYELSMADPVINRIYGVAPGILIDGVVINDATLIGNLDPEVVEKIDVVREKYFVGSYLFYGIVNVITKAGDFSSVALPDYAIRMPYKVIDPVFSFVSPDYSKTELKNKHTPDFRNTLFWNPSVKTDSNGKAMVEFWTSDVASDYEVNIQGISPDGKMFSHKKIISVK